MPGLPVLSVSDFVTVFNQTLEYAYPFVTIEGELTNVRVNRGKWVYFDIKDDGSSVKCFGTVYMLPGPIEDGMMARIVASPRLHPLYNFSLNLQSVVPVGEGSLRRAADLLQAKLSAEGLFDESRKRPIPYPPKTVGLITSGESAAFHDFIKILGERWGGVEVRLYDVLVQGDSAPAQIIQAVEYFNQHTDAPEVLVITRGGGSAEDLAAFNSEQVVRTIAGSRVPTLIAIGHEVDISLAELAADQRASTPTNAAVLLSPDKKTVLTGLLQTRNDFVRAYKEAMAVKRRFLDESKSNLSQIIDRKLADSRGSLLLKRQLLEVLNPQSALRRGYAIVSVNNRLTKSGKQLSIGDELSIRLADAEVTAAVSKIRLQ